MNTQEKELVGSRLNAFRTMRRLSLRDLASLSGVSAGFISQIENGNANASIETLRSLAQGLGVSWLDLFQTTPVTGKVLHKSERPHIRAGEGISHYAITQPPLQDVEVTVSEYEPGVTSGSDDYTHGDLHEILVILKGRFVFRLQGQDHEMSDGDSIDYRTSMTHSLTNIGTTKGEAIWVVTPPHHVETQHSQPEGEI